MRRTGAKRQSRSFRPEQPAQAAAGSPVTRSGKVLFPACSPAFKPYIGLCHVYTTHLRVSEGTQTEPHRHAVQVARTSAGTYVSSRLAGPTEHEEEEPDMSLEVDELLCVTVDACGRSSIGFMNVHFRYSSRVGSATQHAGVSADEDQQYTMEEPPSADQDRRAEVRPSSSTLQAGRDAMADAICPRICCI